MLASILEGSRLDFLKLLEDFSSFLAYFGHVFGCSCFVLLNSFPYRKPPYSKNVGRRYSPQGGFNPPPNRGRRVERDYQVSGFFFSSLSGFFFSEVLVFPLLNPPPVASGRLHLLRRSAALARLGASWAEKVAFQEAFKN